MCKIYKAPHFSWYQHTCKLHLRCSSNHLKLPCSLEAPVNTILQVHLSSKAATITVSIIQQKDAGHVFHVLLLWQSHQKKPTYWCLPRPICAHLWVQALHTDFLPPRISHIVDTHPSTFKTFFSSRQSATWKCSSRNYSDLGSRSNVVTGRKFVGMYWQD